MRILASHWARPLPKRLVESFSEKSFSKDLVPFKNIVSVHSIFLQRISRHNKFPKMKDPKPIMRRK